MVKGANQRAGDSGAKTIKKLNQMPRSAEKDKNTELESEVPKRPKCRTTTKNYSETMETFQNSENNGGRRNEDERLVRRL